MKRKWEERRGIRRNEGECLPNVVVSVPIYSYLYSKNYVGLDVGLCHLSVMGWKSVLSVFSLKC